MKTAEELNALKAEVEALSKKLAELNEEELQQVTGGIANGRGYWTGRRSRNCSTALNDENLNNAN